MKVQTKVTFTKKEVLALIKEKFPQFKEAEIEIESDDVDSLDYSENPWLIPDEDGWFTHNPEWNLKEAPVYIQTGKNITIKLKAGVLGEWSCCTKLDWSVEGSCCDIVKWKYAE